MSITLGQFRKKTKDLPDDMLLVHASDDEGNSFGYVQYLPSEGYFNHNDFCPKGEGKPRNSNYVKVLCIN